MEQVDDSVDRSLPSIPPPKKNVDGAQTRAPEKHDAQYFEARSIYIYLQWRSYYRIKINRASLKVEALAAQCRIDFGGVDFGQQNHPHGQNGGLPLHTRLHSPFSLEGHLLS